MWCTGGLSGDFYLSQIGRSMILLRFIIKFRYNPRSDWMKKRVYEGIKHADDTQSL